MRCAARFASHFFHHKDYPYDCDSHLPLPFPPLPVSHYTALMSVPLDTPLTSSFLPPVQLSPSSPSHNDHEPSSPTPYSAPIGSTEPGAVDHGGYGAVLEASMSYYTNAGKGHQSHGIVSAHPGMQYGSSVGQRDDSSSSDHIDDDMDKFEKVSTLTAEPIAGLSLPLQGQRALQQDMEPMYSPEADMSEGLSRASAGEDRVLEHRFDFNLSHLACKVIIRIPSDKFSACCNILHGVMLSGEHVACAPCNLLATRVQCP
jgi:hypothetical protein